MITRRPALSSERGQTLILFVAMISVVFIAAAIAIDYGFWLSERRGLARASDLAALAAVQDLPEDTGSQAFTTRTGACAALPSCDAAFTWAARNGYGEADGALIRVEYFCANDIDSPPEDICLNENRDVAAFPLSFCPTASGERGCDTVRVIVEKPAANFFGSFFGGVDFDIGASAFSKVDFTISPVQSVMAIDASGSMGENCNDPDEICAIEEARLASQGFAELLLGEVPDDSPSRVGYTAWNDCFDPPNNRPSCVNSFNVSQASCNGQPPATAWTVCLTNDLALLDARIGATQAGGATNICLGLQKARDILLAADDVPENAQLSIVLLTDGGNFWPDDYDPNPPQDCRPVSAGGGSTCDAAPAGQDRQERDMDLCTIEMAAGIKSLTNGAGVPVIIYVVALNPSGNANSQNCGQIGATTNNRRLMKCIATSVADHYFEPASAAELGNIFSGIAYDIAARGLTAAGG